MKLGTKAIVVVLVFGASILIGLGLSRMLWPYYNAFQNRPDPKVYVSVSAAEKSLFYNPKDSPGATELMIRRGAPVFFYASYVEAKGDAKVAVYLNDRLVKEYPLTGNPGIPHTQFQKFDLVNESSAAPTKPNVIELRKLDAQGRTTSSGRVRVTSE